LLLKQYNEYFPRYILLLSLQNYMHAYLQVLPVSKFDINNFLIGNFLPVDLLQDSHRGGFGGFRSLGRPVDGPGSGPLVLLGTGVISIVSILLLVLGHRAAHEQTKRQHLWNTQKTSL
jgi:hypothetical protein